MENIDIPLASHFRPGTLSEFIGQERIVNENSFLFKMIKEDSVPSLIFWGPPGSGKTTLALIIAKETNADFTQLSATHSGVKDLRGIIDKALLNRESKKKTILFIDEIHRWNKAQQDALLPHVENGIITLIGATTENPSFSINSALISRSRVVVLEALSIEDISKIIYKAVQTLKINISEDAIGLISKLSNGDARIALNLLESCSKKSKKIDVDIVKDIVDKPNLVYDRAGDEHYNIISALHKSMRGGDPRASVYWLTRMLEAGEDPLYIARRLVRFASEDVGLANNSALMLINSIYDACKNIGMPECNVHLTHAVIYLAKSPKSILAYQACTMAQQEVKNSGNLEVPLHIRNAPTNLMKELGYGRGYKYTPLEDSGSQEYLPEKIQKNFLKNLFK